MAGQTPSQTVGPFFHYGLMPEAYGKAGVTSNVLADDRVSGQPVRLEGAVYDGTGAAVPDAMIEIWQADAGGRYRAGAPANDGFSGFGRAGTEADGRFRFDTIVPGAATGEAPHVNVIVFARGLQSHAFTRIYFADLEAANRDDPVLALVPESRRPTLLARRTEAGGRIVYRFDIHLQGDRETVFFDV